MTNNLVVVRPMDRLDAERWQEIVEGELFRAFLKRVRGELERAETACLASDALREVRRAQGAAQALQTVLGLPDVLLAEMKRGGVRYLPAKSKGRV